MRSNCESLNGNRSNLEKHILKTLAEEEDFQAYKTYMRKPKEHFKSFIRDEVSRYITTKFNISVLPKMKDDLRQKQRQITEAVQRASEEVDENSGDADLWFMIFMLNLSDVLIFSENDLKGVSRDDVDVKLLAEHKETPRAAFVLCELQSLFVQIQQRESKVFSGNTSTISRGRFHDSHRLLGHLCIHGDDSVQCSGRRRLTSGADL
ncbi:hypothetical protein G5714_002448 [Onychostoma macrolepis]|uniref:Uncharacterized protein n=1 Tax=Onychostoma macrolepis TaxID=369639 RepID=A0A7J6DFV5_9TELE|nr:hypothetical protein G5714_002448 [Onychostoma macrolepis]